MYSKFVLAIRFCLVKMAILVGKWANGRLLFQALLCIVLNRVWLYTVTKIQKVATYIAIYPL